MKTRKALLVVLAILCTVAIAFSAVFVLWSRTVPLLVKNIAYQNVKLLAPLFGTGHFYDIANAIAENGANNLDATEWFCNPSNDHEYILIITMSDITQGGSSNLRINFTDIPVYTSLNISKVDIATITDLGSGNWQITSNLTLISNSAFGTYIPFNKTDVNYNVDATHKRAIVMYLAEYQIAITIDKNATMSSVIELSANI
jgi:hypothetical protein